MVQYYLKCCKVDIQVKSINKQKRNNHIINVIYNIIFNSSQKLQSSFQKIMSRFDLSHSSKQLKLNVINKHNEDLKISIIVGGSLTISHLKRKIQTQFNQLYNIEVVIKVIEDSNGFIISNNSTVQEHFRAGDTIYFSQHAQNQKTGSNMNMASNLGQILSTVRFMTASALQKLDKINLANCNVMQLMPDLLHFGFWYQNKLIIQKVYHIFNKIFGQVSIEKFMIEASQIQMSMLLRNFTFWLTEIPHAASSHKQIIWELIQLFEKFTCNEKFNQIIKNHKLVKTLLQYSKDNTIDSQARKLCLRIVKNVSGGRGNSGMNKIRSQYIPSMLGISNINGYGIQDILSLLATGSPDQKVTALQYLAQNNFAGVSQATVRFDFYQKLINLFSIRKLKTKKHITFFNQSINVLISNTNKDQCIEIVQKDIFKKVHMCLLQCPVETHPVCIQYLKKICKVSASAGMFNLQKSTEYLKSPYPEVQMAMVNSIYIMSEKLNSVSALRFIPGIRDYITLCLKTNDEKIIIDLLKIISNLTLDQQCRYQILNLKGIQVLVKFLQTNRNPQICRASAKGLLNLAISSRENKAKVLSTLNTVLERFYKTDFDSITNGYIETILKSKNI